MSALEIYSIKRGPDGLTRVTARCLGGGVGRSWVVTSTEAEELILGVWAELHDRVLGYPPNWWTYCFLPQLGGSFGTMMMVRILVARRRWSMPKGDRTKQVAFKEGNSFGEAQATISKTSETLMSSVKGWFVDWERGRQGVWEPKLPD
jgi:hypothetical protein